MCSLERFKYNCGTVHLNVWVLATPENHYWFRAVDFSKILGVKMNSSCQRVSPEEKRKWEILIRMYDCQEVQRTGPNNWQPQTTFLSLTGLLELLFSSRLPEAVVFRRWLTKSMLPKLYRKNKMELLDEFFDQRNADEQLIAAAKSEQQRQNTGCIFVASTPSMMEKNLYKIGTLGSTDVKTVEDYLNENKLFDLYTVKCLEPSPCRFVHLRRLYEILQDYRHDKVSFFRYHDFTSLALLTKACAL